MKYLICKHCLHFFNMDELRNGKANITTATSQINHNSVKYCYHVLDDTLDCYWTCLKNSENI